MNTYTLRRSSIATKKYMVITPNGKRVHFGAKGYEDYTIHGDDKRKENYIKRHQKREDWTISGLNTAGFWSLWLLWNKKTIDASIDDIEYHFDIDIVYEDQ